MKTVCKINQCAGCKACVDVCKKEAISVEDAKEFARTIVLFKRENRRFGIKDGIAIPEKHLLLVELLLD